MATDLARSIVAEAHAQHQSDMTTGVTQSRALLRLEALKPCQAASESGYSCWDDTPEEQHLVPDVIARTWGLGKSARGNVALEGPSSAFEIANKPAIALFLSQSFLTDRQKPETKKQQLYDSDEERYEYEVAEKQLEHGQVYVQLLKDQYSEPLFSLNCNVEVQEVASQINILLELYMAGYFLESS